MLSKKVSTKIIRGILTYIPYADFSRGESTGGTNSAKYCYEVWIKHLSIAFNNGLKKIPDVIAELGPGDSLGIGLAGLLSGASKYYALDVVNYAYVKRNLEIFEELIELITNKTPNPSIGFPNYDCYLDENYFPSDILTNELLQKSLKPKRINTIRKIIKGEKTGNTEMEIRYFCPWLNDSVIKENSVDFIYSQSVFEHINDLSSTYKALYKWLKTGGITSHQIDLKCHGLFNKWNGHWSIGDFLWKMIQGKRPYLLLNRKPFTSYRDLFIKNNFDITVEKRYINSNGIKRSELKGLFRNLSTSEFETSGYFIQAKK